MNTAANVASPPLFPHAYTPAPQRPGVDNFLKELSQYYEIVLFSPSLPGVADEVVNSLDKSGCIMHRLYRESTSFINGVHVKDLSSRKCSKKQVLSSAFGAVRSERSFCMRPVSCETLNTVVHATAPFVLTAAPFVHPCMCVGLFVCTNAFPFLPQSTARCAGS